MDVLNNFPFKKSISQTISPSTIVKGKSKIDLSTEKISFGSYLLVYTGTINDIKTRAVPTIALRRSNSLGGHYFMNLYSGKQIRGFKYEKLPIDKYVIARVEDVAEEEEQLVMHKVMPNFE